MTITRYTIQTMFSNATTEVRSVKDSDGEWCIASEALAEVARLREELDFERDCLAAAKRNGAALSAAHEVTKAELVHLRGEHLHPCGASEAKLLAAEARVAELERENAQLLALINTQAEHARDSLDTIDQARGLLQTALVLSDARLNDGWEPACRAWLGAHPATARPDAAAPRQTELEGLADTLNGRIAVAIEHLDAFLAESRTGTDEHVDRALAALQGRDE